MYVLKPLYVRPQALDGDTKALNVRSKALNGDFGMLYLAMNFLPFFTYRPAGSLDALPESMPVMLVLFLGQDAGCSIIDIRIFVWLIVSGPI